MKMLPCIHGVASHTALQSLWLQNLAPKTRPHQACDLLDAPPWAPLKEADRGPLYSSFSIGFMHGAHSSPLPSFAPFRSLRQAAGTSLAM